MSAVELALAEVVGIFEALAEQTDGAFVVLVEDGTLGQLYAADLILRGHLAFAALPGMEDVGIELLHGILVAAHLVEQGDFLEHEVVAALDELRVLLEEDQPFGVRTVQAAVELVELHEDALVVGVEGEGALHHLQRRFGLTELVERAEGEVAPYGGELRVDVGRALPVLHGHVVLAGGVVETA